MFTLKIKSIKNLLVVFAMSLSCFVHGQENNVAKDTLQSKFNLKLNALPILFYLPETKLGFGGAGIALFNIKN
ncbi:MAG: hypothetical protein RLZZ546_2221, partial [Bacteroidota bacterium]